MRAKTLLMTIGLILGQMGAALPLHAEQEEVIEDETTVEPVPIAPAEETSSGSTSVPTSPAGSAAATTDLEIHIGQKEDDEANCGDPIAGAKVELKSRRLA